MPWSIVQVSGGFKVRNKDTGRMYSKHAMSRKAAEAQLRVLYASKTGHVRGRSVMR